MEFNSLEYLIFLILVFAAFWFLNKGGRKGVRNLLVLLASYLFYGWWDPRFLILVVLSSVLDYVVGIALDKSEKRRKILLLFSMVGNLGILFTFKYYDFFVASFYTQFLSSTDIHSIPLLNIALPAGISFYTFQTMSYTIDVYRKDIKACRNMLDFFLFVSYFPQLVAGPIEKAGDLLPQLQKTSRFRFHQFRSGIDLIIYGLFKKVLIADQLGAVVDQAFSGDVSLQGNFHLLGAVLFAIQIYCDFSAYSDMAIGSSRLLGINLSKNFNFPYFTQNPREFWKNWHISLYNWFRDYLFIPLGGSRVNRGRLVFNIILVFALSGLWHGANWTFILWGLYNGLLIVLASLLLKKQTQNPVAQVFSSLINFILILLGWMLFRADNLQHFQDFVYKIVVNPWSASVWFTYSWALYLLLVFFAFEFLLMNKKRWIVGLRKQFFLASSYRVFLLLLVYLFSENGPKFIYFQF